MFGKLLNQKNMHNPKLELIKPKFGSSFELKHYLVGSVNDKAAFWHFHPELELVYVKGGKGVRHIGNHISYYKNGDLVLIGSNLPHNGFTNRKTGNEAEVVIQFKEDFLGDTFFELPEFESIKRLFKNSLNGVAFKNSVKRNIGPKLERLSSLNPFEATIELIKILKTLSVSTEIENLNASGLTVQLTRQDNDRAAKIFQFIRDHFADQIELEEISKLANMTIPSFCRYFKKLTNKTFTNFVNEFRVIEACRILSEDQMTITELCYKVGFNNIAHFNKHFKKVTKKSPTEYRKEVKETVNL